VEGETKDANDTTRNNIKTGRIVIKEELI